MEVIMDKIILKKASQISQSDPDIQQNILAWNFQNLKSAAAKGKKLSIGEQVKFMRRRASNFELGLEDILGITAGIWPKMSSIKICTIPGS